MRIMFILYSLLQSGAWTDDFEVIDLWPTPWHFPCQPKNLVPNSLCERPMRSDFLGKRSLEEMGSESSGTKPMDVETADRRPRGSLLTLLSRPSPFANETGPLPCGEFEPLSSIPTTGLLTTADLVESPLSRAKVLVVGAGGLGCEILKDLAMSGIYHVEVIDMDSIDITNLNRQFLFRQQDVGSSKAATAARFVNQRCPWMKVTAHHCAIQDKDPSFYRSFNVIVSGLDNIEARRWLNATVVGLVEFDDDGDVDPASIIPIMDGGTEGFSGQARIILPRITSCFECTIDSFPPQTSFPLCTIAETPRRPEHCIAYVSTLQWPREFPDKKLDKDSPDDMTWVYERARERAEKYSIPGVTYMLTLGVIKNIIPAVASTNAVIAAACVNEAVKYITFCSQNLNTYMMYMGSQGVHSHSFAFAKKEDCPVCTSAIHKIELSRTETLSELIQKLGDGPLRLKSPSIVSSSGKTMYMQKPPALERATYPNLSKAVSLLVEEGEELTVTDPVLESIHVTLAIEYSR